MKIAKRLVVIGFLGLIMTGCASYAPQSRDGEYLKAKSIPPLRVPPGMSSAGFHNEYPIPERNDPEKSKNVSLVPPGLQAS